MRNLLVAIVVVGACAPSTSTYAIITTPTDEHVMIPRTSACAQRCQGDAVCLAACPGAVLFRGECDREDAELGQACAALPKVATYWGACSEQALRPGDRCAEQSVQDVGGSGGHAIATFAKVLLTILAFGAGPS